MVISYRYKLLCVVHLQCLLLKQMLVWIFPPDIDILLPVSLSRCLWAYYETWTKPVTRALDNFRADVKHSVFIATLWNECAEKGANQRAK